MRDLLLGFKDLKLAEAPVILHASLKSMGEVDGGAGTVVNALSAVFNTILMPTFTYKTMLIPRVGPDENGISYGANQDLNLMAEFFTPRMPADRLMGVIAETLRRYPRAERSSHPILSFAGLNAGKYLSTQTDSTPLEPLAALADANGWVILIGVDHTVNTSIHYAEKLAGRKQFVRWALTPRGVVECPGFPGCSAGFNAIQDDLGKYTRQAQVGEAVVKAVPLKMLFRVVVSRLKKDVGALLCQQQDCERCNQMRAII